MPSPAASSPRHWSRKDDLIETAVRIFYQEGFHVGIDRIVKEAGIAKMTLYHHFRSKEDLILAALDRLGLEQKRWLEAFLAKSAADSRSRILAVFDALYAWLSGDDTPGRIFQGCAFLRAALLRPEASSPLQEAAHTYKQSFLEQFEALALAAGIAEPKEVARELLLLLEGALVMSQVLGDPTLALSARRAAERLLPSAENQRRPSGAHPVRTPAAC